MSYHPGKIQLAGLKKDQVPYFTPQEFRSAGADCSWKPQAVSLEWKVHMLLLTVPHKNEKNKWPYAVALTHTGCVYRLYRQTKLQLTSNSLQMQKIEHGLKQVQPLTFMLMFNQTWQMKVEQSCLPEIHWGRNTWCSNSFLGYWFVLVLPAVQSNIIFRHHTQCRPRSSCHSQWHLPFGSNHFTLNIGWLY